MAEPRPASGSGTPGGGGASVAGFLAHLQLERRVSPLTLDGYRRDVDALGAGAAQAGVDVDAPVEADIRACIAAEHRRGLSPRSLQRRLSAIRGFYRWRLRHGHLAANPAAGVRAPKAPRRLPQ